MTLATAVALLVGALVALLALVLVIRLNAFLALLLVSIAVAVAGGVPVGKVAAEVQQAMGGTLGSIALIVGLGAILGEMLSRSGGAENFARSMLETFGAKRAPAALGLTGLVVAIPVFFDVAFILLIPIVRAASRKSGRPLIAYAIPLLAGLAVAHAFVPPTPGPVAVAGLLGAELGWVMLFGLLAALPATVVGGLWWGSKVARAPAAVSDPPPEVLADEPVPTDSRPRPTAALVASLIALPLFAILSATISNVAAPPGALRDLLQLAGHPIIALLATTLLASVLLGRRCGWSAAETEDLATAALRPVGQILLLTGAGGVLGKMLLATGAGQVVATNLAGSGLPLTLLAFVLALVLRLAQGSATVSMVTAAGLLVPILEASPRLDQATLAGLCLAIASGATACSHVNDSGFWLVSRYVGLSTRDTLRSWTVSTALLGATGLAMAVLLTSVFSRS